ncbi:MAG: hypothetical protein DME25_04340 [Verrucomicrobia bacterium]|nr:MAG: hypothetical protein DME25_04340 [Verrucomicrobiota bacterium]
MILCIGPTPALQRVMVFRKLTLDAVNRALTTLDGAAGKSVNVAKVLKALGERPVAVGFLGGDRGEQLRVMLEAKGIEMEVATVKAETRQCVTVIDQSAGTQTELVEESQPVGEEAYEELLAIVRRRITGCQALVMSGTLTPDGPADFYFRCIQLAHTVGAFSVLDAQGAALTEAFKALPDLVKPNRAELSATLGRPLADERALLSAMRQLCEQGARRVVVTAGPDPALAYDGLSFWRIVPPRIAAVNPIGSGDAFTASLVSRLLRGDNLAEACRWASATGGANALTSMAGEVESREVERLVGEVRVEQIKRSGGCGRSA